MVKRAAALVSLVGVVLTTALAAALLYARLPGTVDRARVFPQSCADALEHADALAYDDVRFVECGRERDRQGEAFELGEPIYNPLPGPSAVGARRYSPGQCEHGGGSVTAGNIIYEAQDIGAAIACSSQRCEGRDALGCRDLGALHWESETLPGVAKDATRAMAAYDAACGLGDALSCAKLGWIYDKQGEEALALEKLVNACHADRPEVVACDDAAQRLLRRGEQATAADLLRRACRGVTTEASPFGAWRMGCGKLAEIAARRGDMRSQREYLRLECAYGPAAAPACQQLGLQLLQLGEPERAAPYLRKACGVAPASQEMFGRACAALAKTDETPERGGR